MARYRSAYSQSVATSTGRESIGSRLIREMIARAGHHAPMPPGELAWSDLAEGALRTLIGRNTAFIYGVDAHDAITAMLNKRAERTR